MGSTSTQSAQERIGTKVKSGVKRIALFRYSTIELLISIVLLIVATPFLRKFQHGRTIEGSLMTIVLISSVFAVGRSRRNLIIATALAVPAISSRWLRHFDAIALPNAAIYAMGALFVGFIVFHILLFVVGAPNVNREVLAGGLAVYLLMGICWAMAYACLAELDPNSFALNAVPGQTMDGFHAFYFSFITLTTVGYGDITPASDLARMLAVLEAITGVLYVGVLISRLAGSYGSTGMLASNGEEKPKLDSLDH